MAEPVLERYEVGVGGDNVSESPRHPGESDGHLWTSTTVIITRNPKVVIRVFLANILI